MSNLVYAIGLTWGRPIKIGVASDVGRRLRTLQSGNPEHLRVLWTREHENAFGLEGHLHAHFAGARLASEWFDVHTVIELETAADSFIGTAPVDLERSDEVIAATAAAVALVDIAARRHGLSIDLALGHVARNTKIRRQVLWHLRYRLPKDIWVSDYQSIALALWQQTKLPIPDGPHKIFVPSAPEMSAVVDQLKIIAFA